MTPPNERDPKSRDSRSADSDFGEPVFRDSDPGDTVANDSGIPDFGLADLQPTGRIGSASPAVGPSDVDDSVKEVLRAAFATSPQDTSSPTQPTDPSRSRRRSSKTPKDLDETGPVDVVAAHGSSQSSPQVSAGVETPMRAKRRFREIARDHDERLRAGSGTEPRAEKAVEQPALKISDDGKKRVVITDDEVLNIKKAAPKEERKRKKTRRRSDGVSRLPSRRWWTRTADGRWRLRWYSVVGVVVAALVLVLLLLTSPLLSIRNIVVEGNVYTNQDRLDEVLVQLKGDAILTADLHGATRQIEAIPWVRKARITMHLPSRIVVQIDEREPTAFYRAVDGFIRVLDREGRVLDVIEGDPVDYVRIIGSGPNIAPGEFVGQPFLGVIDLLGAMPVSLSDRLRSATVSPEGEISLQLTPNLSIIFGQPSDFQVKLVAVVNEIKRQGSRSYTVIDVSTGEPNVR